ncbi:MAG: hypothetical protein ACRD01_12055 [Terriglobales bacterium]
MAATRARSAQGASKLPRYAVPPNFSGTWALNAAKSRNLGMMATMRDTSSVEQTATALIVRDAAVFNGKAMPPQTTRYALDGSSVANTSPTGTPAHTTSRWQGDALVTVWVTEGSVKGSVHRRTERRQLSRDGRTMTLTSASRPGDPAAMVMVFDRR